VVSGYTNPLFDITNNSLGVVRVLEFARQHRCPLIFFSSNRVYLVDRLLEFAEARGRSTPGVGRGRLEKSSPWNRECAALTRCTCVSEEFATDGGQRSIYGLSKLIADAACQEYAHAFDMPIVVNRFGVIAGSGQFAKLDQGWVVWWAIAHYFKLPLKYIGWNGKQVRDILFLEDVCTLVELQMKQMERFRGDIFNLAEARPIRCRYKKARAYCNKSSATGPLSPPKTRFAKPICDLFYRQPQSREGHKLEPSVTIDEGFEGILAWIRANETTLRQRYCG